MRLFLVNNFSAAYARELEKLGHHVALSAMFQGDTPADFQREAPRTLVVTRPEAFYAKWPAQTPFPLKPARPEDLKALAPFAMTIIEQIDRRNFAGWPVSRLRDWYHRFVGFWRSMLDGFSPDAVVFNDIPHGGQDYVLYRLCKASGIPTITCIITSLGMRLMMMRDIDAPPTFDSAEFAATASNDTDTDSRPDDTDSAPPLVDAFIEQFTRHAHSTQRLRLALTWPGLLRHFVTPKIFSRRRHAPMFVEVEEPREWLIRWRICRGEWHARQCLKLYDRMARAPMAGCDYVFFALHNQPEASTLPCGGEFVNQLHALRCLASALPAGWEIYVKEHPRQFRRGHEWVKARHPQFYHELAMLPGVRVMPLELDSRHLIANSRAVATVTGTVGWEAMQMGKPALVFGVPWYAGCPEVRHIRGEADCRAALADLYANKNNARMVSVARVRRFAELIRERASFEAVNNVFHLKVSGKRADDFAPTYAAAIDRELTAIAEATSLSAPTAATSHRDGMTA